MDDSGVTCSQPVFLVASERSGTTLLRLMLDHHPRIAFLGEFEFAIDQIDDAGRYPSLAQFYRFLSTDRMFLHWGFTVDHTLGYAGLVSSFLNQYRSRHNKPLVGATVHRHFDRLLVPWSDARFIHLVRDGRDVAHSVVGMGWAGNAWTGCQRWIDAERLWDSLALRLPAERRIELSFESLVRDPSRELSRVCEWLGVEFDAKMLEYWRSSSYERPNPAMIGKWRNELAEQDVRLVESRIGPMLERRGYELSGLPPIQVSSAFARRLRWHDRARRAKHRLRRYGVPLVVAEFIARRGNLMSLGAPVRLRMNAIDDRYVQ